jgi:hypothetical protein
MAVSGLWVLVNGNPEDKEWKATFEKRLILWYDRVKNIKKEANMERYCKKCKLFMWLRRDKPGGRRYWMCLNGHKEWKEVHRENRHPLLKRKLT